MTLRAVRTIREADVVVVPVTESAGGTMKSRAASIIAAWCTTDKTKYYALPMQRNREAVMKVYDRICCEIAEWYQREQQVVVVVEGDVSIYASIHYVMDQLQRQGIPVVQEPGIPSFIAAAAAASLSLVSQSQRLVVLPGDADVAELRRLLTSRHVVVVMKLSQCQQALKDYLLQYPDAVCHYFENVGTSDAFHTAEKDVITGRQMPYFSLCVLYPV